MPTPADAIGYAKRFVGNVPVDDTAIKLRILNDAAAKLWLAAPWRWSIATVTPVALVNDQQDYVIGSFPGTFMYWYAAQMNDVNNIYNLNISATLHAHTKKGRPERLAVQGSGFRLHPVPTGYTTLPYVFLWYKKLMTAITAGNVAAELLATHGLPDEWFYVYQEIVLLKAYLFDQDPRAGMAQYSNGQVQYTGQYAVAEAAIQEMKNQENLIYDSLGIPITMGGK